MINEKIERDTTTDEYRRMVRMSHSAMKEFKRSPRHYLYYRANQVVPTPAMVFGNIFHTIAIEEALFNERYVVIPGNAPKKPTAAQIYAKKPSPESIEAIEWWGRFQKENDRKIVVSQDDYDCAKKMRDALYKNEYAAELISQMTATERVLTWVDDVTGVDMKGLLDLSNDDMTIDLKSAIDADPDTYGMTAYKLGQHRQAALYLDGRGQNKMKKGEFYFIAVEKEPPFGVSVNKASKDFIERGRYEYGEILESFAHWKEMGCPDVDYTWKLRTSPVDYHTLSLPPWIR